MSDTFDHEGDAWGSLDDERCDGTFGFRYRRPAPPPVCHHCGVKKLNWRHPEPGKWRLYTAAGEPHVCKRTASLDDFDDISND